MRVHCGAHPLGLVARLATPALPVAHKESLLRGEPVERLQGLSLGVDLPRHVSQDQPAEIGDILAQRQLAVDLDVVNDGVSRILV